MTQITPAVPDYPGFVQLSAPVTLAAGVQAAVPYPTGVPQVFSWVEVQNASPYTLAVSQGQALGQIAANGVNVYPVRSGQPVGLLPQAPSGTLGPGQNSQATLTWYSEQPPGSYPASIGSGSVALVQAATTIPFVSGQTSSTARGPFATAGFGGASYYVAETTGTAGNILQVGIAWLTAMSAGFLISQRLIIVSAAGQLSVAIPHMGPFVQVQVIPQGTATYSIGMQQTTTPLAQVEFLAGDSTDLWTPTAFAVAANSTVTQFGTAQNAYAGPAVMDINLAQLPQWEVLMQQQLNTGAWVTYRKWDTGAFSNVGATIPLMIPATPVRLSVQNLTAAAATVQASLTPDHWRP